MIIDNRRRYATIIVSMIYALPSFAAIPTSMIDNWTTVDVNNNTSEKNCSSLSPTKLLELLDNTPQQVKKCILDYLYNQKKLYESAIQENTDMLKTINENIDMWQKQR
jgi:hypothetical protein